MGGEWEEFQFSDLCDITRGASPRPIHDWISLAGTPWVKISDATASGTRFITKTAECIRDEGRGRSVVVYPGDLILSNSATPGMPKLMGIEACIHDGWLLLRNLRRIDKLYAFYVLLRDRPLLVGKGNGSVFTNLKTEILKTHRIKIPPLSDQKAIAHILGTLDDKIELNRRMNATLEAIARALFQSWFVDFDPVRAKLDGRKPVGLDEQTAALFPERFQDSELGRIPEGWEVGTVGEVFNLTMGQSPPGDTYNEEGSGVPFYQGRRDFGFRFPTRRVYCAAPTRYGKPEDTLVSVRAPVGDINMADEECCIGRGVAAVRHKSGASSYTYYAMTNLAPDFARFEGEGTVFGSINKENFEALPAIIAPPEVVTAYERLANVLDKQIHIFEYQSRTLATLRDSLLPKLLSGEVRVSDSGNLYKQAEDGSGMAFAKVASE